MKALILAAGLGTRLRPLTEYIPKPLVPINGKPLLAYHLDQLNKHNITDILINTHYLAEKIDDFIQEYTENVPGLKINITFEKELLGSAGTLRENENFFKDEESLLVVYSDNLTDIDYTKLFSYHNEKKAFATIASYHEEHPEQKGIIEYNNDSKITNFIEKPNSGETESTYANAGIYILNKQILPILHKIDAPLLDFGYHVFPYLLKEKNDLFSYKMTEKLIDIGTLENYNKSQELLKTMSL